MYPLAPEQIAAFGPLEWIGVICFTILLIAIGLSDLRRMK